MDQKNVALQRTKNLRPKRFVTNFCAFLFRNTIIQTHPQYPCKLATEVLLPNKQHSSCISAPDAWQIHVYENKVQYHEEKNNNPRKSYPSPILKLSLQLFNTIFSPLVILVNVTTEQRGVSQSTSDKDNRIHVGWMFTFLIIMPSISLNMNTATKIMLT